jgi:hypothetical protein
MIAASSSTRRWSRARSPAAPHPVRGDRLRSGWPSLLDYMVPTARDIPDMVLIHQHTPSLLNPLGVKGVGEGVAVALPAAIANAICDALVSLDAEFNTTQSGADPRGRPIHAAGPSRIMGHGRRECNPRGRARSTALRPARSPEWTLLDRAPSLFAGNYQLPWVLLRGNPGEGHPHDQRTEDRECPRPPR